jgi:hypothetical protein
MRSLAKVKATFEHRDSLVEVSFAEIQNPSTAIRCDQAEWIRDRLSLPDRCFTESDPLSERAHLGQAPG